MWRWLWIIFATFYEDTGRNSQGSYFQTFYWSISTEAKGLLEENDSGEILSQWLQHLVVQQCPRVLEVMSKGVEAVSKTLIGQWLTIHKTHWMTD